MGGGGSTYDYGFRIYNPQLGKFLSVDPLTASYPWYTPYQFAGNTPIWAFDLDGLEEKVKTSWYDVQGNLFKTELKVDRGESKLKGGAYYAIHNFVDENGKVESIMKTIKTRSPRVVRDNSFTINSFKMNEVTLDITITEIEFFQDNELRVNITDETGNWSNRFSFDLEKTDGLSEDVNPLKFGGMKDIEGATIKYKGNQTFSDMLENSTLEVTKGGDLVYLGKASINKGNTDLSSFSLKGGYVNLGADNSKYTIKNVQEEAISSGDSLKRADADARLTK